MKEGGGRREERGRRDQWEGVYLGDSGCGRRHERASECALRTERSTRVSIPRHSSSGTISTGVGSATRCLRAASAFNTSSRKPPTPCKRKGGEVRLRARRRPPGG